MGFEKFGSVACGIHAFSSQITERKECFDAPCRKHSHILAILGIEPKTELSWMASDDDDEEEEHEANGEQSSGTPAIRESRFRPPRRGRRQTDREREKEGGDAVRHGNSGQFSARRDNLENREALFSHHSACIR